MKKCDNCESPAEWQKKHAVYIEYSCDQCKPRENPYEITWGICMDNKCLIEETCKTCGYRNKRNGHCTLNQLSEYVPDDHSCDKWER